MCDTWQGLRVWGCGTRRSGLPAWRGVRKWCASRIRLESVTGVGESPVDESALPPDGVPK